MRTNSLSDLNSKPAKKSGMKKLKQVLTFRKSNNKSKCREISEAALRLETSIQEAALKPEFDDQDLDLRLRRGAMNERHKSFKVPALNLTKLTTPPLDFQKRKSLGVPSGGAQTLIQYGNFNTERSPMDVKSIKSVKSGTIRSNKFEIRVGILNYQAPDLPNFDDPSQYQLVLQKDTLICVSNKNLAQTFSDESSSFSNSIDDMLLDQQKFIVELNAQVNMHYKKFSTTQFLRKVV